MYKMYSLFYVHWDQQVFTTKLKVREQIYEQIRDNPIILSGI